MRTFLTVIIGADGEACVGAATAAVWRTCRWEVDVLLGGNGLGGEVRAGVSHTILARARGDWLLFYRGLVPCPNLLALLDAEGVDQVAVRSAIPVDSLPFARPWGASTATALAEACHLLVPRAVLAAVLVEASGPGAPPAPLLVTELILRLLANEQPCHLIPCGAKDGNAAESVPEGVRPAAAFRAGWQQAAWLCRYPALRRPGAPSLATHLLACCLLAAAGALLGRPLLLALPPLFLALTLLMGAVIAIRVQRSRDAARIGVASSRLFCDLPFGCGQAARALADLSPANAAARFDCDDRAVSPRFADLVEALWCDHLALLIAIAILAPLA